MVLGTAYVPRIICTRVVLTQVTHEAEVQFSWFLFTLNVPRDTAGAGTWFPVLVWLLDLAEDYQGLGKSLPGCDIEPLSSEYG